MKLYEGLFILNPSLSPEGITDILAKVEAHITKRGGSVNERLDRGKKRLGYEIQKKNDGYVATITFSIDPLKVKELDTEYKLIAEVLKFTLYRADTMAPMSAGQVLPNIDIAPVRDDEHDQEENS